MAYERMVTIVPFRRRTIDGNTSLVARYTPPRLVSTISVNTRSFVLSNFLKTVTPALLTRMSTGPRLRTMRTCARRTDELFRTSHAHRTMRADDAATRVMRAAERDVTPTAHPALANASASARPMPLPAPVTQTTGGRAIRIGMDAG